MRWSVWPELSRPRRRWERPSRAWKPQLDPSELRCHPLHVISPIRLSPVPRASPRRSSPHQPIPRLSRASEPCLGPLVRLLPEQGRLRRCARSSTAVAVAPGGNVERTRSCWAGRRRGRRGRRGGRGGAVGFALEERGERSHCCAVQRWERLRRRQAGCSDVAQLIDSGKGQGGTETRSNLISLNSRRHPFSSSSTSRAATSPAIDLGGRLLELLDPS